MKPILTAIVIAFTLQFFSCDKCDMVCENDCEVVDEDACDCIIDLECQCSNGLKDGNEEYIDCGGDCEECGCSEEDSGIWCTYLTNDSIKTWKYGTIVNIWTGDTITRDELTDAEKEFRLSFSVDHTYYVDTISIEDSEGLDRWTWRLDSGGAIRPFYLILETKNPFIDLKNIRYVMPKLDANTLEFVLDHPYWNLVLMVII